MPIYQAWNPKINAWVKYEFGKQGFKIIDVKQNMSNVKFRGVPVKGNKR